MVASAAPVAVRDAAATHVEAQGSHRLLTGQPVNGYVIVDFSGFANLVDEVGGVYLDVDRRYYNKNIGTAATNYAWAPSSFW